MDLQIYINGYIGDCFDFFGDGNSFTLAKLNQQLDANPNAKSITIHINSGGGLVSEGFAIYDKLVSLNKPVTTIVEGMCGSIATVIAQAGKTGARKMFQNSEYFIHNPLWIPSGPDAHTADDLERLTADLRSSEEKLINFYAKVTGADREILSTKMTAETTLSAAEAKSLGFIDEVINTDVVAMVKYRIAATVQPLKKQNNNTMSELKDEIKTGFADITRLFTNLLKGHKLNATVKTTEGVDIYFDGALEVGTKVFLDEAMTQPAPDGVHTYEGKEYVVVGGVVTEVKDASVVSQTEAELQAAKIADLEAKLVAAQAEKEAAIAEKNQILAKANEAQSQFMALKNKIETGGSAIFNAEGTDKVAQGGAKQSTMQQVVEARKQKEEAAKK